MKKAFVALVIMVLIGLGVTRAASSEPTGAGKQADVSTVTTHPTSALPKSPGDVRRRVPQHTGKHMTHTTGTVVVIK